MKMTKMILLGLMCSGIANVAGAQQDDGQEMAELSQFSGPCYLSIYTEYKTPPGVRHTTCAEISKKLGTTYSMVLHSGDGSEQLSREWAQLLKQELEKNPNYRVVKTGSFPKSNQTDLLTYSESVDKDASVQAQIAQLTGEWEKKKEKERALAMNPPKKICEGITIDANATDAQKYQLFQSIFKDQSISAECRDKLWLSISKSYRDQKEGEYLKAHPEKIQAALNHACGQKEQEEKSKCEQSRYQAWSLTPVAPTKAGATQLICRIQNGADAVAIETSLVSTPKCPQLNARAECFYNDVICDGPEGSTVGMVSCPSINDEGRCPDISECANFTCPTMTNDAHPASSQAVTEE